MLFLFLNKKNNKFFGTILWKMTDRDHALEPGLVEGQHGLVQRAPDAAGQHGGQAAGVGGVLLQQGLQRLAFVAHLPDALLALPRPVVQHAQPAHLGRVLHTGEGEVMLGQ